MSRPWRPFAIGRSHGWMPPPETEFGTPIAPTVFLPSEPWPDLCPGRSCLLHGQSHEHTLPPRPEEQWRCPGCDQPYEKLPVGHHWTYQGGGSCGTTRPVSPVEFYAAAKRRRR